MTMKEFTCTTAVDLTKMVKSGLESYDYDKLYDEVKKNEYYTSRPGWRRTINEIIQLTLSGLELLDHSVPHKLIGYVVGNIEMINDVDAIELITTDRLLLVIAHLHEINLHLVGSKRKVAERSNLYM